MKVIDQVSFSIGKSKRKRVWVSLLADGSFVIGCKRRVTKKQSAELFCPMEAEHRGCQMIARVKYTKEAMGAIYRATQMLIFRELQRRLEENHKNE